MCVYIVWSAMYFVFVLINFNLFYFIIDCVYLCACVVCVCSLFVCVHPCLCVCAFLFVCVSSCLCVCVHSCL